MLTVDQLRRLLKACDGKDFAVRRDTASIRLLIDTGIRLRRVVVTAPVMSPQGTL